MVYGSAKSKKDRRYITYQQSTKYLPKNIHLLWPCEMLFVYGNCGLRKALFYLTKISFYKIISPTASLQKVINKPYLK